MASAVLPSRNAQCWGERKAHSANYRHNPNNNPQFTSRFNPNPNPIANPNPNLPQNLTKNANTNIGRQMGDLKNHTRQKNEPSKRTLAPPIPAAFHASQLSHQKPEGSVQPKDPFHREYVTFNIASYSKLELKQVKRRLKLELQSVRSLLEQIEGRHIGSKPGGFDPEFMPPPSIQECHHASETSAGKRIPKRNQQSGSSAFLRTTSGKVNKKISGQKRALPFATSPCSKRSMVSKLEVQRVENAMMMKCKRILMNLLKLKHAFVFSKPVDVQGMKLRDYHQIIKQPMDLGTVKSRLNNKEYQTPLDFASDVRLTFENALRYNPKGHEVNTLADSMLQRFEKLFGPEYEKYESEYQNAMTENPVEKRGSIPKSVAAVEETPSLSTVMSSRSVKDADMMQSPGSGNLPKLKKAKDLKKRPMTSEEKLNLVAHLENILPDKMEQVIQIMRQGSPHLLPDGGDIELDIEALDTETLWELDRFVRNHKRTCGRLSRQDPLENASVMEEVKSASSNEVLKSQDNRPSEMQEVSGQKNKKWEAGEEDIDIGEELPSDDFPPVEIDKDPGGGSSSSGSSSASGGDDSSSSASGKYSLFMVAKQFDLPLKLGLDLDLDLADTDSGSPSGSDSDEDSAQARPEEEQQQQQLKGGAWKHLNLLSGSLASTR